MIRDSESGPELLNWIADNREKAAAIYRLPPLIAAMELGKVGASLEAAKRTPPPVPVVTKAPPPPPTLDADEAVDRISTTDPASDKLTDEQWIKAEQKRLERKRKRHA